MPTTEETITTVDQTIDEAAAVAATVSPANATIAQDVSTLADQGAALASTIANHPNVSEIPEIVTGFASLWASISALFAKHSK